MTKLPSEPSPARNLDEIYTLFDPTLEVDPEGALYVPRVEVCFQKLLESFKRKPTPFHAFLCGHRGSGKTTELKRLVRDPHVQRRFFTVVLSAADFGNLVNLTPDALLVEIGLGLIEAAKAKGADGEAVGLDPGLEGRLANWGQEVVNSYLKSQGLEAEAGAGANAWIAFFKAMLSTRREWKTEQKLVVEPKVKDLIFILDAIAQDLENRTGKKVLVVVDDLEKGESDADKEMHQRLFQESYEDLVQPAFSILYTLPIYFRALPGSRIPNDQIYAFSAARLYRIEDRESDHPPIDETSAGTQLMRQFVAKRMDNVEALVSPDALKELLLIGGGLFRETARAVSEAAFFVGLRHGSRIELQDAKRVFDAVKKEYQPMIRGAAVDILQAVLKQRQGWVVGVEPFLQSRAIVEYENGDLWLDLRTVIKRYVRDLEAHG